MTVKHIVLVGVAAVGKTTMGMKAAERLGLPFTDNDKEAIDAAGGKNIDAMLRKHGEKGWDRILFEAYKSILSRKERHVIAACPRLYDRRGFWTSTAKKAHSIHLASDPLSVLSRDMKNRGIEKKITAAMKRDYLWYYDWRIEHCRKAENELLLKENLGQDVESLCEFVSSILREEE